MKFFTNFNITTKIILSLILFTNLVLLYLKFNSDFFDSNFFYNSDNLYLESFFRDIIINGNSIKNWYFPPVSYFFPDFILVVASKIISFSIEISHNIFILLYFILTIYFSYYLCKLFSPAPLLISLIAFSFLNIFSIPFFDYIFVPSNHYGSFLNQLILMALFLKLKFEYKKSIFFILITVLSISILSDKIILLHLIIPALILIFICRILYREKKFFNQLIFIVIISFLISKLLGFLILNTDTSYKITYNFSNFINNIKIIFDSKEKLYELILFTCINIILIFKTVSYSFDNKKLYLLNIFQILSYFLCIIVFLFSEMPFTNRYNIPLYYLSILIFLLNINLTLIRNNFFLIILILILIFNTTKIFYSQRRILGNLPDLSCFNSFIQKTNAKSGISGYWESKFFYSLSNVNLKIAQFNKYLKPQLWITTTSWYSDSYDFIIYNKNAPDLHRLDINRLININGAPDNISVCDDYLFLYYKNNIMLQQNFFSNSSFDIWKGNFLPSQTGSTDSFNNRLALEHTDKKGFISFGPFIKLIPGKYQIEVKYKSSAYYKYPVANFDIMIDPNHIIYEEKIYGTNNEFLIKKFEFILSRVDALNFQSRLYYFGNSDFLLDYIKIIKIN